MEKIILLVSISCLFSVNVYSVEHDWIAQDAAGDDVPLNESFSYSREEEESPLVEFLKSLEEIMPKKFKGDIVFRTRQNESAGDPLKASDYWYEKFSSEIDWGKQHARMGILSLQHSGEPGLSSEAYCKYRIKKIWVKIDSLIQEDSLILGNYKAQYGQGLVMYGSIAEFSRPILVKSNGLRIDKGTNPNAYLNGMGWESRCKQISYAVFFSRAWLSADVTQEGDVDENLNDLKDDYGYLETEAGRMRWRRFYEDLAGAHLGYELTDNAHVGITGYEARYSKQVDPSCRQEKYAHVFRGDRNTLGSIDINMTHNEFSVAGEYAFSASRGNEIQSQDGNAWAFTPIMHVKPWKLFVTVYDYDPTFYNRHAKGPSFNNADPNNQQGHLYGAVYALHPQELFVTYRMGQSEQSEWSGSATSTSPRFPADLREIYVEYKLTVNKRAEIASRLWYDTRDRYIDTDPTTGSLLQQTEQERKRYRLQFTWKPEKKFRYLIRYDNRIEKIDLIGERLSGDLIFGEISYKPFKQLYISFRQTVFDSGGTYLSQYEPVWHGIYQSESFFSQNGIRSLAAIHYNPKEHLSGWIRYGRTELSDGRVRDDIRVETSILF
ncbi:MAG: hypothetical protein ABII23_09520 [bacterium]